MKANHYFDKFRCYHRHKGGKQSTITDYVQRREEKK